MSELPAASDLPSTDWKLLWAKSEPRHPLWKHLLDTSAVSLMLPSFAADFGWKPEEIALFVGLHDIGKADSSFQYQIQNHSEEFRRAFPPTGDAKCRHERISAAFIKSLITDDLGPFAADAVSRAVVAHHGDWNDAARSVAERYANAQNQLCRMLRRLLRLDRLPSQSPQDLSAFGMRLTGHVVLCDWIASNEKFFCDPRLTNIEDPEGYFSSARDVAREWVSKLGLERDRRTGKAGCVVKAARPIQQILLEEDIPPGLAIIEAPMGEGKTEAAWILAEKWRGDGYHGMYMALPTMATSDSLYNRYRKDYLEKLGYGQNVKLVHGMAWLRGEDEPEKPVKLGEPDDDHSLADMWFRPTRQAMLAEHGVGTVDQAMLAGMNVKFGFLRLYGLAGRVLVIDEVHAYDAYMSAIIARLLRWCACLKIPVVMLSATLTSKQRAAMIDAYGATGGDLGPGAPYPLITVAEAGKEAWTIEAEASSSRTLRFETHPGLLGDAKKTAAKAMELVKDGGCCCVILNTVKQAQAVYQEIELSEDEKLLFHARFLTRDRQKITDRVLSMFGKDKSNRPTKFVLVATQVAEQSLDVDFDHMISEIAPMDLLLQRSGRLHRHQKREYSPVLHVLLPEGENLDFGSTGYVYADKPLIRTLAILSGQQEVHLSHDFRLLVERCYCSDKWEQSSVAWEAIEEADRKWEMETQALYQRGRQFALNEPKARVFWPVNNDPSGDDSDDGNGWRANTRFGANDRTAVLVEEAELLHLETGELPMEEVRDLYRRSLKLPNYLPIESPAPGYKPGVVAKGRLRGLVLLPLSSEGIWQGIDKKGNLYKVAYHEKLGLLAGRV